MIISCVYIFLFVCIEWASLRRFASCMRECQWNFLITNNENSGEAFLFIKYQAFYFPFHKSNNHKRKKRTTSTANQLKMAKMTTKKTQQQQTCNATPSLHGLQRESGVFILIIHYLVLFLNSFFLIAISILFLFRSSSKLSESISFRISEWSPNSSLKMFSPRPITMARLCQPDTKI